MDFFEDRSYLYPPYLYPPPNRALEGTHTHPTISTAHEKQVGGQHYKDMAIQPYEYIVKNNLGWLEGNAIKYISRYKQKGGKADIEKAIHYLELLLEQI